MVVVLLLQALALGLLRQAAVLGLVAEDAFLPAAEDHVELAHFHGGGQLEHRLAHAVLVE